MSEARNKMRHNIRLAAFVLAVPIAISGPSTSRLRAQSPPDRNPSFEVASIKPNKSGDGFTTIRFGAGGRITATNISLRELLKLAYEIRDFQLSGGPNRIISERFDIEAKAEGDAPPRQLWPMVRTLAADRFKLMTHIETRELPVYALVLARKDGKLGPQLHQSEVDCAALNAARGRISAAPPGLCAKAVAPGRSDTGRYVASNADYR